MPRIYDPTDDPAVANTRILAMSYEILVLEDRPHGQTAEFAEALLTDGVGKVAILAPDGTPVIVGDRRCKSKPWVVVQTGSGWESAAGAIVAEALSRRKNMS